MNRSKQSLHRKSSDLDNPDRKIIAVEDRPEELLSQSTAPSVIDLPTYYDLDSKYSASRGEIWSYYLYLVANSGATLSNFAPTAFQNLLSQAAGDQGTLPFAGK